MNNPLFQSKHSPTKTTRPTKAVNEAPTQVRLTHNTFDNSYFNFKTQRYGQYEPFWWKVCTAGDNEPFSNSHNVRSLPFASPVLSPMKLNKDYFQVPMYAIQPNVWDYIFKNPTQGDDVPLDSQNLFPITGIRDVSDSGNPVSIFELFTSAYSHLISSSQTGVDGRVSFLIFLMYENFLSSGSLLYNLGYKFNPVFWNEDENKPYSYDQVFDQVFSCLELRFTFSIDDPDSPSGSRLISVCTSSEYFSADFYIDKFTAASLLRSHVGRLAELRIEWTDSPYPYYIDFGHINSYSEDLDNTGYSSSGSDFLRMDVVNAYQLSCAQYYVNPRVDFIYNAQLYRDNFIQLLREFRTGSAGGQLNIESFDMNGIPVLYDYFSLRYYRWISYFLAVSYDVDDSFWSTSFGRVCSFSSIVYYLFGFREQLKFGDYIADSRPQALGYGEPGSDTVQVMDNGVNVTDLTQSLVLQRFRGAVAHLDNTAEDYLSTMFHEQLPPDYHYPKFIVHSEFGINGEEIANTTSDNQGHLVTNLKSGEDTAEFNIEIPINCILIGISYVSLPAVYCQIKERSYMHLDRYDMFQPMLQYFGDQGIYNREVSDFIPNPSDAYGYTSRNGEYKQRMSQCSGGFVNYLRSWIFTIDLPEFANESSDIRFARTQSPIAIRTFDFQFNRFLSAQTGVSLGTGFHFIMQYNNKNVDNRPMDVNPLPLYPSNTL